MSSRITLRRWHLVALIAIVPTTLVGAYAATNTSAWFTQRRLHALWASVQTSSNPASLATRSFRSGDPVARIVIPSIHMDLIAVEGNAVHGAPTHLHTSAIPGLPGITAIEGGRFGYGNQFMSLDRLNVGDEIVLETLAGRFQLRVQSIIIEPASQIDSSGDAQAPTVLLIAPSRVWGPDRIVVRAA